MFKLDPTDTKPCWHMRTLVSSLADDHLTGALRRFTEWHIENCPQCQHGLATLHAMHSRLASTLSPPDAPLPPPRWAQVEAAWEQADNPGKS